MEDMTLNTFIEHVAGLMTGIQVAGGMGVLGSAKPHWIELREALGIWGWEDAHAHKKAIRDYLSKRGIKNGIKKKKRLAKSRLSNRGERI